jgi:hypothetical protein
MLVAVVNDDNDDDAGWGSSYQCNAIFCAGKSEWISRSKTRGRLTLVLGIPCGDGVE